MFASTHSRSRHRADVGDGAGDESRELLGLDGCGARDRVELLLLASVRR